MLKEELAIGMKNKIWESLSPSHALAFVFSVPGFTAGALKFFREKGIAWSKDTSWFDI